MSSVIPYFKLRLNRHSVRKSSILVQFLKYFILASVVRLLIVIIKFSYNKEFYKTYITTKYILLLFQLL